MERGGGERDGGREAQSVTEFSVINNQCSVNTENKTLSKNQGFLPLPNTKGKTARLSHHELNLGQN